MSIGIIGCGMVGNAVSNAFNCDQIISDTKLNDIQLTDVVEADPECIFICLPTNVEDAQFNIVNDCINNIIQSTYTGVVVVKSTVLPSHVIEHQSVVYNPEFLTRTTADHDFVNPMMFVLGGERSAIEQTLSIYNKVSNVTIPEDMLYLTTPCEAMFIKYLVNCFYAVKVTYMNQMKDVADTIGIDFKMISKLLKKHPWIGSNHVDVPGPDGSAGFGGPCLPKDLHAFKRQYKSNMLELVEELNAQYRKKS